MDKNNAIKQKIVILGAGISGMISAIAFAKYGIEVTIIESRSITDPIFFNDTRTTALTPYSKAFLQHVGIWDDITSSISNILDIYVVDNKHPNILHFASLASHAEKELGYIIENTEFKKLLLNKIICDPLITLIDKTPYYDIENKAQQTIITLGHDQKLVASLVVICDGKNSLTRQKYFTNLIYKNYHQSALTFNVLHAKTHNGTAVEHFLPTGPFAILPLKNLYKSSIVWTIETKLALFLQNLPQIELEYLVQRNFGEFLGKIKIENYHEITSFPLIASITKQYFYNNMVLVADSAHTIHPLAGQGLNQGIKDIEALVTAIKNNICNNKALIQYQQNRQADNMAMYFITDSLNMIFSNPSKNLHFFRIQCLKLMDNITYCKQQMLKYAKGKR